MWYTFLNFMKKTSSTSRYILTGLAIILVITAFILVGLNALNLQQFGFSPSKGQLDAKYKEGYLAAKQNFQTLCPIATGNQQLITGKITHISGNTLTVDASNIISDQLVDGMDSTRTITITASTTINSVAQLTQADYAAKIAKIKVSSPPGDVPSAFITTKILASDLKVGDTVTITTLEDAQTVKQLIAGSINLTPPQPVAVPPLPPIAPQP